MNALVKKISIVTTLYKSEPYVDEFYERCLNTIKKLKDKDNNALDYEFVFVDDGSPDSSLQKAITLHKKDPKVAVIELSRNFGHHKAIMTGLTHSEGDFTFLLDSDLEEEPELLEKFWIEFHKKENQDVDVIYGVQEQRRTNGLNKWLGAIFYTFVNFSCSIKVPRDSLVARIMTNNYRKNLIRFKENSLVFIGLAAINGFNQKALPCKKLFKGSTSYSFLKKISMIINSIFSFSTQPLYFMIYFGFFFSFISTCAISYLIIRKFLFSFPILGWTSTLCSIYLVGGTIMGCLGITGIYISKIFEEVKNRPYTIIKNFWKNKLKGEY